MTVTPSPTIDRKAVYRQWRDAGRSVAESQAAARCAYVIGHRQHNGKWVPVLSTDISSYVEAA